eukprot:CAMPEP_0117679882 /NCGR_PEP_ID=MMETSP0804-20121206/18044_1 /TAXON_ID=1074897 /ORGANISM="Tetraselmis astigmatica, Strain CCMP880" /LENGTH=80 /DNA_ID=CAMNT_0005489319 /DNA_START=489 /DNA_END=731 /DNA_ORIENTATION=+
MLALFLWFLASCSMWSVIPSDFSSLSASASSFVWARSTLASPATQLSHSLLASSLMSFTFATDEMSLFTSTRLSTSATTK